MDKDSPRSVLDVPVQMSDDGSVSDVFTDSEQRDLHYDAYSIDWQGRSIPYSSIGGGELGAPSSSTGPRRTSTTKGGVADMLLLFCAFNDGAADAGPVYLADEGDDGELEPAEEAVRQDSGGASTAEAESADDVYDSDSDAIYASESDPNGIIGDDFHAKYSIFTDDDDTNVAAEAREAAAALAAAAAIAGRDAANTAAREAVAELEVCARERRDAAAAAAVAAAAAAAARDEAAAATGKFHAECSVDTGVLTRREEPLSLPALDETSVTGCTYGDIIKSPPPHLRAYTDVVTRKAAAARAAAAARSALRYAAYAEARVRASSTDASTRDPVAAAVGAARAEAAEATALAVAARAAADDALAEKQPPPQPDDVSPSRAKARAEAASLAP